MKFENKQLLIFDLDGTLINSALDLALAVNTMLETLGRDTFDEEVIHGWVGNGALRLVQRSLSGDRNVDKSLDEASVQKALDIFLKFYAKTFVMLPFPTHMYQQHLLHSKRKGIV